MGKAGAQLVEDGETVGIDIAPVIDLALPQPACLRQYVETIAGTEDQQAVCNRRKGEKIDLVFGDEDARNTQLKASER